MPARTALMLGGYRDRSGSPGKRPDPHRARSSGVTQRKRVFSYQNARTLYTQRDISVGKGPEHAELVSRGEGHPGCILYVGDEFRGIRCQPTDDPTRDPLRRTAPAPTSLRRLWRSLRAGTLSVLSPDLRLIASVRRQRV